MTADRTEAAQLYRKAISSRVGYDNERGKGDHRHYGGVESDYAFSTPDQLMLDFHADIARWNHEHGDS